MTRRLRDGAAASAAAVASIAALAVLTIVVVPSELATTTRVLVPAPTVTATWHPVPAPRPQRHAERREQVPAAPRPTVRLIPAVTLTRASRSQVRAPLAGGPRIAAVAARSRPFDAFTDAPHTHAGLAAFAATLRWPWPELIGCESLRDDSWRPSSPSRARGILQFEPETWASLGLTGDPAAYPWRFQVAAGERLLARDGLRAWQCSGILGLS